MYRHRIENIRPCKTSRRGRRKKEKKKKTKKREEEEEEGRRASFILGFAAQIIASL
jgi:hypothetical protein